MARVTVSSNNLFPGPRGAQGPAGPAGGPEGPTGPQGPQGNVGPQGPQGIQGPAGPTGPGGAQGLKGDTGNKGDKGDTGEPGTNGTNGAGVVVGGTANQALTKIDSTDYNTQWTTIPLLDAANTFTTSPQQINGAASAVGLIVRANATTPGNLQEWKSSAGTTLALIGSSGSFTFGPNFSSFLSAVNGRVEVQPNAATVVPIVAKGFASQTANLFQAQNSAGTVLFSITSGGAFGNQITANAGIDVVGGGNGLRSIAGAATVVPIVSRGAVSQTAALQRWEESTGTVLTQITSTGDLVGSANFGIRQRYLLNVANTGAYLDTNLISNAFAIVQRVAGNIALVVRGAASQSTDLMQWQDSTGSVLSKIQSNGRLTTDSVLANYLQGDPATGAFIDFENFGNGIGLVGRTNTAANMFVIRGMASQTGDLQQWQNSAGTVLARVTNAGAITAASTITGTSLTTSSAGVQVGVFNSGGYIRIEKATASATTGSTTAAQMFLVTGTNANTLKLVIRSNGAETTIIDNIPTT
jgi:hypothetical protein